MSAISAFIWLGFFSLALNTWADLKEKEIDSRRNWLMYGATVAIILTERLNIWFYIIFVVATVVFTNRLKKMFLEGDTEALRWIVPGFFTLNWAYGLGYLASFALTTIVYVVSRRTLKIRHNTAGYPILLGAFVITAAFALKF